MRRQAIPPIPPDVLERWKDELATGQRNGAALEEFHLRGTPTVEQLQQLTAALAANTSIKKLNLTYLNLQNISLKQVEEFTKMLRNKAENNGLVSLTLAGNGLDDLKLKTMLSLLVYSDLEHLVIDGTDIPVNNIGYQSTQAIAHLITETPRLRSIGLSLTNSDQATLSPIFEALAKNRTLRGFMLDTAIDANFMHPFPDLPVVALRVQLDKEQVFSHISTMIE